ncbi:MAG: porin [Beijerinckiaceae bacterium]
MRLIGGALLAATAVLTFAAGAQAADLPSRKAAAVEYVKICDVFGRGFYYIPGTNTCLKVGGRVRFEFAYRPSQNVWVHGRTGGTFTNGALLDTFGWRSRAYVNMDARTQTAWGAVQTVVSISLRSRSGVFGGSAFTPNGQNTASPQVYAAYIRFAGFTVGRARGNFYFMPSDMYEPQYYASSSTGEVQLAYTATFGGGFSATLAIEDRTDFGYHERALRATIPGGGGTPAAAIFPNRDVVAIANLRVDQSWGQAQIMGAWVPNSGVTCLPPSTGACTAVTDVLQRYRKPGWAVGAGLKLNLPMLAKGDAIWFMAAYADGALDFTHSRYPNGNTSHGRMIGGMSVQLANVILSSPAAGVLQTSSPKSWSVATIMRHYWTPTLRSNFAASYMSISPDSVSKNLNWYTQGGYGKITAWSVATALIWSPTSGFDIGLEVAYRKVNNGLTGVGPVWGTLAAPNTIGVKQNPGDWVSRLRVDRRF